MTAQSPSIKADADVMGAVRRSLAAWSAVTGIEFRVENSEKANISPSGLAGDGINLLTIGQTQENLQVFAADPFGESARTRVFYDRRGAITEGDIVLNPLQQFSTDGTYGTFDLETTLTHEIGHLLGLRHSAASSSIMAQRIPRNADVYSGPRPLTQADIAAARDLYKVENESCCGAIAGRLTTGAKPAKNVTVWAEDADGRVAGVVQTDADGAYRIGGLPDAKYSVVALRSDGDGAGVSPLGKISISSDERGLFTKRLGAGNTFAVDMAGLGQQPSDGSVEIKAGRQYTISITGRGLRDDAVSLFFSTSSIRVDALSSVSQVLSDGRDLVTFTIFVDSGALPGAYTIYAQKGDARAALVGGFVVAH